MLLDILVLFKTRIDGNKGKSIIESVRYDAFEVVEGEGYASGIQMAWHRGKVDIIIIKRHFQYLDVSVNQKNKDPWFLTIVYASLDQNKREELWSNLIRIN